MQGRSQPVVTSSGSTDPTTLGIGNSSNGAFQQRNDVCRAPKAARAESHPDPTPEKPIERVSDDARDRTRRLRRPHGPAGDNSCHLRHGAGLAKDKNNGRVERTVVRSRRAGWRRRVAPSASYRGRRRWRPAPTAGTDRAHNGCASLAGFSPAPRGRRRDRGGRSPARVDRAHRDGIITGAGRRRRTRSRQPLHGSRPHKRPDRKSAAARSRPSTRPTTQ